MDYFDTLRSNSWLADPGERNCSCDPRLMLVADPLAHHAKEDDYDLPQIGLAANE